jgi:ribokinase
MIAVAGSLNMDLVTYVSRMPKTGETIRGSRFKQIPGGKGANQADAIAKLGLAVKMIGCVGEDDIGEALLLSLSSDGVDISNVSKITGVSTGIAAITVDGEGNNCIAVVPGANDELGISHITSALEAIKEADVVVVQLEVPLDTVSFVLKEAKRFGKITILNPAPALELPRELFTYIDLLVPNDTELEILSGISIEDEKSLLNAANHLLREGVNELIVTLGDKGCIHVNRQGFTQYEAYKVKAIDTTAAGDSFIGAMAVALSEGKPYEEAIPFAAAVGALTVTREGAQSSLPLRSEVEAFIRS